MSPPIRSSATCALILLATITVCAQDLPPALGERFSQGVADLKAGQLDAAEAAFRDVLRGGGERAFVHHNLGIVLRERGRHADALGEFRAAIKLDPAFGPARLLAGTSLLALARVREARLELERAVQLMPQEVVAQAQLADACQRLGDRACVADVYRRLVQIAPDNAEYAYRLGSAYMELAKWAYERIAKSDPTRPGTHLALARIHFDQGRLDDAAREVERELALVPSSADARELKARIESARR